MRTDIASNSTPPRKITLLMTASIDPRGCDNSLFTPHERLHQYHNALIDYLRLIKDRSSPYTRIIFVENSGANLTNLANCIPPELTSLVEFQSLDPNQFSPEKGKSHNEILLISKALENPLFDQNELIAKVTGRYFIRNLRQITECILESTKSPDFCCDLMQKPFGKGKELYKDLVDTRCIFFKKSVWQAHFKDKHLIADNRLGVQFETIAFQILQSNMPKPGWSVGYTQPIWLKGLQGHYKHIFGLKVPKPLEPTYNTIRYFLDLSQRRIFGKISQTEHVTQSRVKQHH